MQGISSSSAGQSSAARRAGLVLVTLILAAGIANINLAVANVALPDIAPSARLVHACGSRVALLAGYLFVLGTRPSRQGLPGDGMQMGPVSIDDTRPTTATP